MKKLLFFVLLIFPFIGLLAQDTMPDPKIPFDKETRTTKFSEVVHVDGSKDELFNRCVYWLNSFYKSPTRVTHIRDLPSGKILGIHNFPLYTYDTANNVKKKTAKVNYTFTIVFKDGRYKWQIDQLEVISSEKVPIEMMINKSDSMYRKKWKNYLIQVDNFVKKWSSNLMKKMQPEAIKQNDDSDW